MAVSKLNEAAFFVQSFGDLIQFFIDLHTRYVVGWSISNTMTDEWCVQIVQQAIDTHGKPQIINFE